MGGVLRAELLKLQKRPATWVLGSLAIYFVMFQYYIVEYITYRLVISGAILPDVPLKTQLAQMSPELWLENVMESVSTYGTVIAIILGALVAGNEYGWGTLKTVLAQRPSRTVVYMGQAFAVGVVTAFIVLAMFVISAGTSWLIAVAEDGAVEWSPVTDILLALGAAWLILMMWAVLGTFLGTYFRGSAVAIGVGLAWQIIVEGTIFGFLSLEFDRLAAIQEWLPGPNAATLSAEWGSPFISPDTPLLLPVSGDQYLWMPAVYVVGAILLGIVLFRSRDVM